MKKDWNTLTDTVRQGIEDIAQGKQDVEEIGENAEEPYKTLTGDPADEPRYDSAWVAEVQRRLTATGLNPGPIDGAFGKRTAAAIVAFQRSAGLAEDGLPRPSTMRALRARAQPMIAGATPQADPSTAAPGGGALGGPPGSPAGPAPGAPAAGGGLIAPAPPGLATPGGGLVAPAPDLAAPAPGDAPAQPAVPGQAAPPAAGASAASTQNAALVRQFGLRTALGRPVVADFSSKHRGAITDAEDEVLQRFFDLALLGLNPHAVDAQPQSPQRALCLANRFLSEPQKDEVLDPLDPRLSGKLIRDWKGAARNELEAARARQLFLDTYLPQIVAAAPQFPLEFVFIASLDLLSYDTARGGFPVRGMPRTSGQDSADGLRGNFFALPNSQCFGGQIDFLPFPTELPTFWQIDPQTAERQVIERLPPPRSPVGGRQAFAGIVFSVAPAAAATGARDRQSGLTPIRVAIHSVAIYEDPDLERLIHSFSLDAPAPSVLLTGMPQRVPAADEVLLTKESAALLLLKNQGDVLGADAWTRLAALQSSNDQAYYAKKDDRTIGRRVVPRQRQTFDPDYVPFFPAGFRVGFNSSLTPDQLARFKQWILARASALPDRLVLRGEVHRDHKTDMASLRLGAGGQSGGQSAHDPAIGTLVQQGYVPGQVVLPDLSLAELGYDAGTDVLNGEQHDRTLALVLPNLLKQYAPEATIEQIERAWGLAPNEGKQSFDVEVAFDLERVDVIPIDPASSRPGLATEVVTIFARPMSLRYFDRNGAYAALQQSFDVAALDPHQTAAPAVAAPARPYADRVPFSAEVADLLIANYLPDALTEAEPHRMLLARWHYETDFNNRAEEPLGGRFFVEGTPRPGAQERAPLLVPFRDWTLSRAQAAPMTVTLRFAAGGSTRKPGPVAARDTRGWVRRRGGCPELPVASGQRAARECGDRIDGSPDSGTSMSFPGTGDQAHGPRNLPRRARIPGVSVRRYRCEPVARPAQPVRTRDGGGRTSTVVGCTMSSRANCWAPTSS